MRQCKSHKVWLRDEFQSKYLRKSFRNSVIHFSIIESIILKLSNKNNFSDALFELFCSDKLSKNEFIHLRSMQTARNKLIHRMISEKWDENKINSNINVLMEQIIKTYKEIKVINAELNNLYGIII